MTYDKEALHYHQYPRPGKIEVVPLKPCLTQSDLSLAYTPGVAVPCLKIKENPDLSFEYTSRGNLIGVVSNGTAVLGLGNIGPLAGKPVMEGKGVLFKRFANIDVFDIEVDAADPDAFIRIVQALEPTFGGINLEDIKAPECFYIEEKLAELMSIPVFHDDQHGTAIISGAALLNAVAIAGKSIGDLRIVINGAGAAGIACARMYVALGADRNKIYLVDTRGIVYRGRKEGMNPYKEAFAADTDLRTLDQAAEGADVLVGLSAKGAFTGPMLRSMARQPIIFALANPDPEIDYPEARALRPDAIIATGRSDYPNQVNNVLGFPYIFRGALDVRATRINEAMKVAAVKALADLAREDVPDAVIRAYGGHRIVFGPEYIIPKPLDSRVLLKVVPAVAEAAVQSGVARVPLPGRAEYVARLESLMGLEREIMRKIISTAQQNPKRIVLPEGNHSVILRAAQAAVKEGIARPLVLGNPEEIGALAQKHGLSLDGIEVLDHLKSPLFEKFVRRLFDMRKRKGWTMSETRWQMRDPYVFGAMMVHENLVDGQVHGIAQTYPNAIRPVLQVIAREPGVSTVAGLYLMIFKNRTLLFADTTVNIQPSAEVMAEIAILSARMGRFFGMTPRIAMLSFSNFGSTRNAESEKVRKAVDLALARQPDLVIDGEMQADTAVMEEILAREFPFNRLGGPANILIFPSLAAGNIAYKLLDRIGGAKAVGPLLMGISKPFNVLQRNIDMETVFNVIAITVMQAQSLAGSSGPPSR